MQRQKHCSIFSDTIFTSSRFPAGDQAGVQGTGRYPHPPSLACVEAKPLVSQKVHDKAGGSRVVTHSSVGCALVSVPHAVLVVGHADGGMGTASLFSDGRPTLFPILVYYLRRV